MNTRQRRAKLRRIAKAAADFAAAGHPKFPWRHEPTAYTTLVAEFFLQRTGATQATQPYRAFLEAYPTFSELSKATDSDVITAMAPLGLRHRARTFTRLIAALRDELGGRIPRDERALLALPGVGRYTARAVLCFAYGCKVGVVDVNTARVLCRAVSARKGAPSRPGTKKRLLALANEVAASADNPCFTEWGLLDIGREICTEEPECANCPLRQDCAYLARKEHA